MKNVNLGIGRGELDSLFLSLEPSNAFTIYDNADLCAPYKNSLLHSSLWCYENK